IEQSHTRSHDFGHVVMSCHSVEVLKIYASLRGYIDEERRLGRDSDARPKTGSSSKRSKDVAASRESRCTWPSGFRSRSMLRNSCDAPRALAVTRARSKY